MSLPWFRVDVDFVDHPKVMHLESILGPNAGWYLVRLWAWTARYASRGCLTTVARQSLERSAGWTGKPGELIAALLETGLVDETTSGNLEVHDWWEKQRAIVEKAEKDRERLRASRDARGIVVRQSRDARAFVAGDETRRDETKETMSSTLDLLPVIQDPPKGVVEKLHGDLTDDEWDVFEHWRVTLRHPKAVPTKERKKLIAKWLPVYGRLRLRAAIEGCARSPFHLGQNDRNTRFDSLELILRDAKHIEALEAIASAP